MNRCIVQRRDALAGAVKKKQMNDVQNLIDVVKEEPKKRLRLCLHAGAVEASFDDVARSATPAATEKWTPVPHAELIKIVRDSITNLGLQVAEEAHALSKGDARYFGLMQVVNPGHEDGDFGWVLGLRNSHDKTFPAAMAAGMRVFVCDNLAFSGEVQIRRRHTIHIMRDLPGLVSAAAGQLMNSWNDQAARVEHYKGRPLTDMEAHDFLIRAVDARALPPTSISDALQEWRHPSHESFADRNLWSLFNAVTSLYGDMSMPSVTSRSLRLHALADSMAGLSKGRA